MPNAVHRAVGARVFVAERRRPLRRLDIHHHVRARAACVFVTLSSGWQCALAHILRLSTKYGEWEGGGGFQNTPAFSSQTIFPQRALIHHLFVKMVGTAHRKLFLFCYFMFFYFTFFSFLLLFVSFLFTKCSLLHMGE